MDELLKSLEAALSEQVFDLKPVPAPCETLTLDGTELHHLFPPSETGDLI